MSKIKIKLWIDTTCDDPRERCCNVTHMALFHRRYKLSNEKNYNSDDYNSFDELKDDIIFNEKPLIIKPVYMYDHSGIVINTIGFSCPWDSGQIGFIWISEESAKEGFGGRYSELVENIKLADKIIEDEIKIYNAYLSGNVYGFSIYEEKTDPDGYVYEKPIDSCGGFYLTKGFDDMINDMKCVVDEQYANLFDGLSYKDIEY